MTIGDRYFNATSTGTVSIYGTSIDNYNYDSVYASVNGMDELQAKVDKLEDLFFRKVVVQCEHCGQWGAALCACKHCGAPIGYGDK